ncbi:hypothetical protein CYMTET_43514, partial [Cymbomonas tetramitiformis]
ETPVEDALRTAVLKQEVKLQAGELKRAQRLADLARSTQVELGLSFPGRSSPRTAVGAGSRNTSRAACICSTQTPISPQWDMLHADSRSSSGVM